MSFDVPGELWASGLRSELPQASRPTPSNELPSSTWRRVTAGRGGAGSVILEIVPAAHPITSGSKRPLGTLGPAAELLGTLRRAPLSRHQLQDLIDGAWSRRNTHRPVDALYVELAEQLRAPQITTDSRSASSYPQAQLQK
jgi:hypothetical protein